jgi:8-oxo-dGTP diphosphatase
MNAKPIPAVSALIVQDGKVLLVKRGCEPNKGLWSLPGGSIELGETAREAAAREVLEETGLAIAVGEPAGAHDVISRDGDQISFHYVIITFHAKVISGELRAGSDASDARWVSPDELIGLATTPGLVNRFSMLTHE